jgi:hypothetical protein
MSKCGHLKAKLHKYKLEELRKSYTMELPASLYELDHIALKVSDLCAVPLRPSADATKVSALRAFIQDVSMGIAFAEMTLR